MDDIIYKEYLAKAKNVHLAYYIYAAEQLGIEYSIFRPGIGRFKHNDKIWGVFNGVTSLNDCNSKYFSVRKNLATEIFNTEGLPTPKQANLASAEEAIEFLKQHKRVVIKPVVGLGGKGITLLPESEDEVVKAYNYAHKNCARPDNKNITVLGEEYFVGQHYRLLVLGGRVIGAVSRRPGKVEGDGVNNINGLIALANIKRKERNLMAIPVDDETKKKLALDNISLDTIPTKGQEIFVRLNTNLSTGGTTRECMAEIHPYYLELAIKANKVLGLTFGGVDLMAKDITDPKAPHAINEVNHYPGLRIHYKVDEGKPTDVAIPVMKAMAGIPA